MKELKEIIALAGLKILSEKAKDGTMTVYAKFTQVEKLNKNKRIYGRDLMKREISRVKKAIQSGAFLGQADHGDTPAATIKDTSHIVTGLELKGDDGYATLKILKTDAGKNIQELIRGGAQLGISTRGVGTWDEKTSRVNQDFRLMGIDIVSNPSVPDAVFSQANVFESQSLSEEPEDPQKAALIRVYQESLEAGFRGSFHSWKEKYPKIVTEVLSRKSALTRDEKIQSEAKRIFEGLKAKNPNSSTTLESVVQMLEAEAEKKGSKTLRQRAINRVVNSICGAGTSVSQGKLEKMIESEYRSLKEEIKKKNQAIFLKILSDSKTK